MTPAEVEQLLEESPRRFQRMQDVFYDFPQSRVQVQYADDARLEFVEAYLPRKAKLADIDVLGSPVAGVLSRLGVEGIEADEIEGESYFYFYDMGWAFGVHEESTRVDAVSVHRVGYYS